MEFNLWRIIGLITSLVMLSTVFYAVVNFKHLNKPGRILFVFLLFASAVQVYSFVLAEIGTNNIWLLHLYTLGEFSILQFFFYDLLIRKKPKYRVVHWMVCCMVITLIALDSTILNSIKSFNTVSKAFECMVLISYSLAYYVHRLKHISIDEKQSTINEGLVLINSSILIFFSGQFGFYLFSNYVLEWFTDVTNFRLWIFNSLLNLFFYVTIFIGLWKLVSVSKKQFG